MTTYESFEKTMINRLQEYMGYKNIQSKDINRVHSETFHIFLTSSELGIKNKKRGPHIKTIESFLISLNVSFEDFFNFDLPINLVKPFNDIKFDNAIKNINSRKNGKFLIEKERMNKANNEKNRYSLDSISNSLGISHQYLCRVLNNKRKTSLRFLVNIAIYLDYKNFHEIFK